VRKESGLARVEVVAMHVSQKYDWGD